MYINEIIRQINITIIFNHPHPILEWFDNLCESLYVYDYNNEVYYYIIDKDIKRIVFYMDYNKNHLECSSRKYWEEMEMRFRLCGDDIERITRILIDRSFNIKTSPSIKNVGFSVLANSNTPVKFNVMK